MDRVEPLARFSLGGAGAISPTVRIDRRRRREEGDEREQGRNGGQGDDDAGREDEPRDGRPHVDVLA